MSSVIGLSYLLQSIWRVSVLSCDKDCCIFTFLCTRCANSLMKSNESMIFFFFSASVNDNSLTLLTTSLLSVLVQFRSSCIVLWRSPIRVPVFCSLNLCLSLLIWELMRSVHSVITRSCLTSPAIGTGLIWMRKKRPRGFRSGVWNSSNI